MLAKSTFPQRLKSLREMIGITQDDFAKRLDVSRPTISYYEKGERTPDIDFLDRVHDVTGCSVAYLLGYSDSMKEVNAPLRAATGLSDKSISVLEKEEIDGVIVNYIIEHDLFKLLIRSFRALSLYRFGLSSPPTFWGGKGYVLFAISRVMETMAQEYAESHTPKEYLEDSLIRELENIERPLGITNEIIAASKEFSKATREGLARLVEALKLADQKYENEDPIYRFRKQLHAQKREESK